jgi:hypothetical protein
MNSPAIRSFGITIATTPATCAMRIHPTGLRMPCPHAQYSSISIRLMLCHPQVDFGLEPGDQVLGLRAVRFPVNAALSASFSMRTANCPREGDLWLSDSRRFLLSNCNRRARVVTKVITAWCPRHCKKKIEDTTKGVPRLLSHRSGGGT